MLTLIYKIWVYMSMTVTTAYNAVTIQIYFITNENASQMVHSNRILGQFPIKGGLRIVDVLVYIRLYIVLYMFLYGDYMSMVSYVLL